MAGESLAKIHYKYHGSFTELEHVPAEHSWTSSGRSTTLNVSSGGKVKRHLSESAVWFQKENDTWKMTTIPTKHFM